MLQNVVISLPIADRPTSHAFYRDALGLEAIGELADDGLPEPLQFELNESVRLMLIPTGGFGWVAAPHEVAPKGASECLLGISVDDNDRVDALLQRVEEAGATILSRPGDQPWAYMATFEDPDAHVWMITGETYTD